jgi:hypothetical protein
MFSDRNFNNLGITKSAWRYMSGRWKALQLWQQCTHETQSCRSVMRAGLLSRAAGDERLQPVALPSHAHEHEHDACAPCSRTTWPRFRCVCCVTVACLGIRFLAACQYCLLAAKILTAVQVVPFCTPTRDFLQRGSHGHSQPFVSFIIFFLHTWEGSPVGLDRAGLSQRQLLMA